MAKTTRSSTGRCSDWEMSSKAPTSFGARHSLRERGMFAVMVFEYEQKSPFIGFSQQKRIKFVENNQIQPFLYFR